MTERVVYAIDLGTTYTKCAFVNPETGKPTVVAIAAPLSVIPTRQEDIEKHAGLRSAVALGLERDRRFAVVGQEARTLRADAGLTVIEESKAWIGRAVDPDEFNAPPWHVAAHGWDYRPEDVGALVLRRVKAAVDRLCPRWPMTHVVITHPQNFEDTRREATRQAGRLAGLEVVGTISEPNAAAVFFGVNENARGRYMIFDLGGGTLDVTVAEFAEGGMRALGNHGSHAIAGRDHDRTVFDYLVHEFGERHRSFAADVHLDDATRADWMRMAEQMKEQICGNANSGRMALASRDISCINEQVELESIRVQVDGSKYEQLTTGLTRESVVTADVALSRANLRWGELAGVVMVGGSSANPWIRQALEARLGRGVTRTSDVNPTTTIVLGAAIYGAQLSQRGASPAPTQVAAPVTGAVSYTVASVVPRSLGILARRGGQVEPVELIRRGDSIPNRVSRRFKTTQGGAAFIPIQLYEWPDVDGGEPELVAMLQITGLPSGRPAGQPVSVTIEIDASNQKTVTAVDEQTGIRATTSLQYDSRRVIATPDLDARARFLASIELRLA